MRSLLTEVIAKAMTVNQNSERVEKPARSARGIDSRGALSRGQSAARVEKPAWSARGIDSRDALSRGQSTARAEKPAPARPPRPLPDAPAGPPQPRVEHVAQGV